MLATSLSTEQLRQLTPQAARELLAQPGLDTRQRDALQHALHGRRSARAAPELPPDSDAASASAADAEVTADTKAEPQAEPEPEPSPEPSDHDHHDHDHHDHDHHDHDHHDHDDSQPEPEPAAEPRADSGEDSGDSDSDSAEQEEPDSQGVTQERANSTAPAPARHQSRPMAHRAGAGRPRSVTERRTHRVRAASVPRHLVACIASHMFSHRRSKSFVLGI